MTEHELLILQQLHDLLIPQDLALDWQTFGFQTAWKPVSLKPGPVISVQKSDRVRGRLCSQRGRPAAAAAAAAACRPVGALEPPPARPGEAREPRIKRNNTPGRRQLSHAADATNGPQSSNGTHSTQQNASLLPAGCLRTQTRVMQRKPRDEHLAFNQSPHKKVGATTQLQTINSGS